MKTIAAILEETGKPLQIEEINTLPLKPGQVLVKVLYTGVCRSQLNEIRGLKGIDRFLPHTLGHEGAGVIIETGSAVTKVKPGDHAVLTWLKGQGRDEPSVTYERPDGSKVNSGAISTFLTTAVISENRVIKIEEKMPMPEASLLGCAIPTGAGIVFNTAKIRKDETVAIFGVGGIGFSALLASVLTGASAIIALDNVEFKLKQAMKNGATHTINTSEESWLKSLMDITGGKGVDYAIECSGVKGVMEMAFRSVRDKGGLCIIAGNLPQGEEISINPFDLIKGRRIIGTWGGESDPEIDIPRYADLFLKGFLDLKSMAGPIYGFRDINTAIEDLEKGTVLRAILEMPVS